MNSTPRIARVTKLPAANRDAAMPPAKSRWLRITPPNIVPRALVSRGSMVTRKVASRGSVMDKNFGGQCADDERNNGCPLNVGEPSFVAAVLSLDDIEKRVLNIFGHRPASAAADLPVVHFANPPSLRRRPGNKSLF